MFRKSDGVLILLFILSGVLLFSSTSFSKKKEGAWAIITIDGAFYEKLSLHIDQERIIDQEDLYHKIQVKNGQVQMMASNCQDQYCVRQGSIHYDHENIICLPHRVVITIQGGTSEVLDTIAQ